jgi:uncharacterized protein
MLLTRSLTVPASADRAWSAISDLQVLAACLPGARLDALGPDGSARGTISIRAGAVRANFEGQATIVERDDARRVLRVLAEGDGSQGRARATVDAAVAESSPHEARIDLRFEIDITGRLASLGQGMAEPVIDRLIERFAQALAARVGGDAGGGAGQGSAGAAGNGSDQAADLDLMSLLPALPAAARYALIAAGALAVGFLLGRLGRRGRSPQFVVVPPDWERRG